MREFASVAEMSAAAGQDLGVSDWFTVDQLRIDRFADATEDHQWIHVEPARAAASPFGSTIAHGYLTLSLVPRLLEDIYTVKKLSFGVNYGADRLRFPAPLPVDARIRASASLVAAEAVAVGTRMRIAVTVESDRGEKPVCVVDLLFVLAD